MPTSRVTASDPAVEIVEALAYDANVQIKNSTGTGSVFLGDEADTDDTSGLEWETTDGNVYECRLPAGVSLYGFAAVDQDLQILALGAGD